MENKNCEMPDYKALYEEESEIAQIHIDKCKWLKREIIELRAIKATVEAFLGRKIEVSEEPNDIKF